MEPHAIPPLWLETLSWAALLAAFLSAVYILFDIYGNGYRQKMKIMDIVYPTTALYWGPVAVWFYRKYGRVKSPKYLKEQQQTNCGPKSLKWYQVGEAVSHCGAGCTLGDIAGEWLVLLLGLTIAGTAFYANVVLDFIFAWSFGIIFQYFTIVPMRHVGKLQGVWQAIKVDTLSIVAYQIGMYIAMLAFTSLVFHAPLPKTTASYWFLMQLAMVLGFFTAYPVNAWLIKAGIKEKM